MAGWKCDREATVRWRSDVPARAVQVQGTASRLLQRRRYRLRQFWPLRFVARPECAGDPPIAPYQHLVEVPAWLPASLLAHPGVERRRLCAAHMRYAGHRELHIECRLTERLHRAVIGRLLVEVLRRH